MSFARSEPKIGCKFTCGTFALIFAYWAVPPLVIEAFFPKTPAETRASIALGMWILFFGIIAIGLLVTLVQDARDRRAAKQRRRGKPQLSFGAVLSDDGEIEYVDELQDRL